MADEKIFADGFSFKTREGQPDFVVGRLSIKVEHALSFLKERASNGWGPRWTWCWLYWFGCRW